MAEFQAVGHLRDRRSAVRVGTSDIQQQLVLGRGETRGATEALNQVRFESGELVGA
jgi:hypothetical protein